MAYVKMQTTFGYFLEECPRVRLTTYGSKSETIGEREAGPRVGGRSARVHFGTLPPSAVLGRPSMSAKTKARRLDARKVGRFCIRTAQIICGVHLFNEYIAEIRPCSGASMYPTLSHRGNYILNSPLLLRLSPPTRGTLVSAISPLDPSHQILKRVIGLPGDSICVDPSGVRRLGKVEYCDVPKGHVWLAGDNMSNSTDSRDYGPVPAGLLRGKVVARIWPNPSWLGPNVRPVDHI